MYKISTTQATVRLSDDLEQLIYGNDSVTFNANHPFTFIWRGTFPISAGNMKTRAITAAEDSITLEFSDLEFPARWEGNSYFRPSKSHVPDFRFTVRLSLSGGDLLVHVSRIENLGDNFVELQLCQDFFCASTRAYSQLILPVGYGVRLDFPRNDIFSHYFYPSNEWTLPVHALMRSIGGIGLWCEDLNRRYSVTFNTDASRTLSAACNLDYEPQANTERELRFMLFSRDADFRQLGRRCRELRMASGRFRTLSEKIREHSEVGQLPGTVVWKHNIYYKQRPEDVSPGLSLYVQHPGWNGNEGLPNNWTSKEIFETALRSGFDRVAALNTGWNRDGYDSGYPSRLPVNPERGSARDFQEAAKEARLLSPGFSLGVHDNYVDIYQGDGFHAEELLQEKYNPYQLDIWRGGQSYRLCSVHSLKYARRDLPQIAELTGRGCIYLDVIAAIPLACCYAPGHPMTRRQDLDNRRAIFSLVKNLFGALATEGCATDNFADLVDIGAYGLFHFPFFAPTVSGPEAVPIPLWQMVYHDSVLNYQGDGVQLRDSEYRLYQALYTLLPTAFTEQQKQISHDLRSTFTAEMLDFADLIPRHVERARDGAMRTYGVARSLYSDGTAVIANFNDAPYWYEDSLIPPRDYLIIRKHESARS